MLKEKEFYEEKMVESAEALIDIADVHKARVKQLGNIFKFGYGQKPADFNLLLKVMNDSDKLRKIMNNFITVYRYYQYVGIGEKIKVYLAESGIDIDQIAPWNPVNEDKANRAKFASACGDDITAKIEPELLKDILEKGMENLSTIEILNEDVKASAEEVEVKCDITKSIFKKSVSLKAMKLAGKDVSEKIKGIEAASDQFSQVSEMI